MQKYLDQYLLSVKKRVIFPIVLALGFIAWLFMCTEYYDSYWNGTINRVQNADFNLLHHSLPLTLSQLIIAGRDDAIQNVLDSTYGLFGLVITDPSGDTVLYRTNKVYHRESWQHLVTPEDLSRISQDEPFDLLTDPPPLEPVWKHESPRTAKATREPTSLPSTERRVLGHLYYVRPDPPSFVDDLGAFFATGPFELAGSKRGYLFITLAAGLVSLVVILLIWLRMHVIALKQQEVDHIQRELEIRKKALEHLSQELATQKERKIWLEKEADQAYRRAVSLKQALMRLRDGLSLVGNVTLEPGKELGPETSQQLKVRPALHPPSYLLEEIESLIPTLTDNAGNLRSQATLLHDYCSILEQQQAEMKQIVDTAYLKSQNLVPQNNLDMSPR